jgi:hypothetical protein
LETKLEYLREITMGLVTDLRDTWGAKSKNIESRERSRSPPQQDKDFTIKDLLDPRDWYLEKAGIQYL